MLGDVAARLVLRSPAPGLAVAEALCKLVAEVVAVLVAWMKARVDQMVH